ncbi:MAG: phenylalanine--tRNA ligase subunit alpha [Magnetococcales bacterium]|nr:phenylalanine--tRNA ligase subunit alpha [Magnetococcales bacterium]
MLEQLLELQERTLVAVAEARSGEQLERVRVACLGRKGELTQILRGLGALAPEERKRAGELSNQARERLQSAMEERLLVLNRAALAEQIAREQLDVTLPGRARPRGGVHPVARALDEIGAIFQGMGFTTASGPEVESDWYNFEALNLPPNHPAREMQDTFYLPATATGERLLLRTHTSPVQIHVMEQQPPPLRVIAPGRVFRCDSDLTHTPMFHQVEGFMVDERVHFGHLKGVLAAFLRHFFARELPVRFRPSFFPFTEPSAEVDMGCLFCQGEGCRVCKGSGWLEVLGCGMIHPAVLAHVGIDRERYAGFAFGMGVERLAMLKYGIGDLRNFFDNDVRFLRRYGASR